ncbi:MAG: 6-phosphogluconolactonase [Promethearchaeota archaeon]
MNNRRKEVRTLIRLSSEEVLTQAANHLIVCEDLQALYLRFAQDIANEIRILNSRGLPTRLILPVGPIGQYPLLVQMINKEKLSLEDCWFFIMDEYCDESGRALPIDHPLSFKRIIYDIFFNRLEKTLNLRPEHIFIPDELNINRLTEIIDNIGGIDTCYGGIGIHGHIAFNEPEPGVSKTDPRKVQLNDFTRTINAIRAEVGGNLECFPREAFTLGMKQILNAQSIRLYCRNGSPYDWANTILRIALFAQPGDDYPVTHIRNHDYVIVTDQETLACPKNLL